jgi:hypothetical protein
MKLYIVEITGFDNHSNHGIFLKRENAENRRLEIVEQENKKLKSYHELEILHFGEDADPLEQYEYHSKSDAWSTPLDSIIIEEYETED